METGEFTSKATTTFFAYSYISTIYALHRNKIFLSNVIVVTYVLAFISYYSLLGTFGVIPDNQLIP